MSSSEELLRELERDDVDDMASANGSSTSTGDREHEATRRGFRSRLPNTSRLFSPRGFLVSLVLTIGAFLVGGLVPLIGGVTGLVGIFAAGFLLGLLGRRYYLELGLSGATTAGLGLLLDQLVLSFVGGFALPVAAIGAAAGLGAAVLGHYFGRDLHHGLTEDL
jgi:hypothetical protein